MTVSQNKLITATDYNAIRNVVASVMGTGSATRGYGQIVNSLARSQNQKISESDWDLLRLDLLNARIHQSGTGSLAEINENDLISAGTIALYEQLRTTTDNNRFNVAAGQFLTVGATSTSRTYNADEWKNEISCEVTATFANANRARWFFNSGGTIRIQSSRTTNANSRSDAQNVAWTNILNSAGMREFGAQIPTTGFTPMNGQNFYRLTNSFQQFYSLSGSSPYAANRYALEARCNVADNSNGTATSVTIRVRFIDGYVDPPLGIPPASSAPVPPEDGVNGIFTVTVTEKRADGTGSILPSGDFTIQRPTYSITSLTGS